MRTGVAILFLGLAAVAQDAKKPPPTPVAGVDEIKVQQAIERGIKFLRTSPSPGDEPVRESKVTVKIPRPLYRRIQQVVEDSGFNSPTDFIVYVLRDLMGEAEEGTPRHEFTQEELDDVKRKLRNLGYL